MLVGGSAVIKHNAVQMLCKDDPHGKVLDLDPGSSLKPQGMFEICEKHGETVINLIFSSSLKDVWE